MCVTRTAASRCGAVFAFGVELEHPTAEGPHGPVLAEITSRWATCWVVSPKASSSAWLQQLFGAARPLISFGSESRREKGLCFEPRGRRRRRASRTRL